MTPAWLREVSGAFGDLGTFLPYVLGAITLAGLAPTGVLLGFGAAYLAVAVRYRAPIPVQPMKAVGAVLLVTPTAPGAVAAAGLFLGAFFLLAGACGLIGWLSRHVPEAVTAGIQLGLAIALGWLALDMIAERWWLGIAGCAVILAAGSRLPAALLVVALAVAAGQALGFAPSWPSLDWGWHRPPLLWPDARAWTTGLWQLAVPQVPLTVTNAIIVTAAVAARLYPGARGADERSLSVSTGVLNLATAPFGGFPMCHGAGGVGGHYRFGARGPLAPAFLGLLLVVLAVGLGPDAAAVLATVPRAALGALLLFSAWELAAAAELQGARLRPLAGAALIAAIAVLVNPAVAFVAGCASVWAWRRLTANTAHISATDDD